MPFGLFYLYDHGTSQFLGNFPSVSREARHHSGQITAVQHRSSHLKARVTTASAGYERQVVRRESDQRLTGGACVHVSSNSVRVGMVSNRPFRREKTTDHIPTDSPSPVCSEHKLFH